MLEDVACWPCEIGAPTKGWSSTRDSGVTGEKTLSAAPQAPTEAGFAEVKGDYFELDNCGFLNPTVAGLATA